MIHSRKYYLVSLVLTLNSPSRYKECDLLYKTLRGHTSVSTQVGSESNKWETQTSIKIESINYTQWQRALSGSRNYGNQSSITSPPISPSQKNQNIRFPCNGSFRNCCHTFFLLSFLAFIIWTSLLRLKIYMCFSHWIS